MLPSPSVKWGWWKGLLVGLSWGLNKIILQSSHTQGLEHSTCSVKLWVIIILLCPLDTLFFLVLCFYLCLHRVLILKNVRVLALQHVLWGGCCPLGSLHLLQQRDQLLWPPCLFAWSVVGSALTQSFGQVHSRRENWGCSDLLSQSPGHLYLVKNSTASSFLLKEVAYCRSW